MLDTYEMRHNEIVANHESLRWQYSKYWSCASARNLSRVSAEESAYYLLAHSGMLYRYTNNPSLMDSLVNLTLAERESLVSAACRFLARENYADHAREILGTDPCDDRVLNSLEQCLVHRDMIDVAMRTIGALGRDFLQRTSPTRRDYLTALDAESAFDDVLRGNRTRTAYAAERIIELREHILIPLDSPTQWWFTEVERWMEELEAPSIVDDMLLEMNRLKSSELANRAKSSIETSHIKTRDYLSEIRRLVGSVRQWARSTRRGCFLQPRGEVEVSREWVTLSWGAVSKIHAALLGERPTESRLELRLARTVDGKPVLGIVDQIEIIRQVSQSGRIRFQARCIAVADHPELPEPLQVALVASDGRRSVVVLRESGKVLQFLDELPNTWDDLSVAIRVGDRNE